MFFKNGLSFVEPNAAPIVGLLKSAFDQMPPKRCIKGADLLMIRGVLALLRDPVSLIEHGKSIIKGQTPESVLQLLVQADDTECSSPSKVIDSSEPIPNNHLNQPPIDSLGLW